MSHLRMTCTIGDEDWCTVDDHGARDEVVVTVGGAATEAAHLSREDVARLHAWLGDWLAKEDEGDGRVPSAEEADDVRDSALDTREMNAEWVREALQVLCLDAIKAARGGDMNTARACMEVYDWLASKP